MNIRFCSLLALTAVISGCAYTPTHVQRRITFEELNRFEINCSNAIQQINFLNKQRLTRAEQRQSAAEVSTYHLLSNFNGLVDKTIPRTADYRQHLSNVHDDHTFYINFKINQINEYCLENYVNPAECRQLDPESQACKNLASRSSRSQLR